MSAFESDACAFRRPRDRRVRRDRARCTIGSRYANEINLLGRGCHFVGHDPSRCLFLSLSLSLSPFLPDALE